VVLAWNQLKETIECIESILKSRNVYPNVIVVDNGSTDNTSDFILSHYKDRVKLIHSNKNLGVPKGYNLGLKYALKVGSEYILITNNDVVFAPSMINSLVELAKSDSHIGIVSPLILNYYNPERIWMIGARWRRFPPTLKMISLNAKFYPNKYHQIIEVQFIPSCCYLITKRVLSTIGFYDEGYFIYFDDWDFSIRVRQAGYKILCNPSAIAFHKVSFSTKKQQKPLKWWKEMGYSASRYYRKHHRKWEQIFGLGWMTLREIIKLNTIESIYFLKGVLEEIESKWI